MQALADIKVLDLTHVIAGPFCTFQLGVMGADVIKIEPPGKPDMCRMDGGRKADSKQGMGSMYQTQGANKRALAVDIKTIEGRDIVLKIAESADVLVENYRPGALKKLGLGYEEVRKINPGIVYCSLTGFGQTGPLSSRTAYDNVIQAMSGLMASTGTEENAPIKVGPPVLDYGTGIQGAFAIVSALYQRTHTGEGQRIDLSMLDAAIMLSATNFSHLQASGNVPPLSGNSSPYNAGYGCYQTKDGLIVIGAWTGAQLADMWQVLGDLEISNRVRNQRPWEFAEFFASDSTRLTEIALTDTADNWEIRLNAATVPAARVRDVAEAASHPHLQHRGLFQSAAVQGKKWQFPTAAFTYETDGPSIRSAPPAVGEHTQEVLQEAGYSSEEIQTFLNRGITSA